MSHANPRDLDLPPRARRGEPAWGTRLLTLLLRLGVLAIVVMVYLVCKELGEQAREKTAVQAAHEAELNRKKAAAAEALRLQREREERLLTDPTYVEYVARDQLGLARPGETVILVDDPDTEQASD